MFKQDFLKKSLVRFIDSYFLNHYITKLLKVTSFELLVIK